MKLPFGIPRPPAAPVQAPSDTALYVLFATTSLALAPHLIWQPAWLGAMTLLIVVARVVMLARNMAVPATMVRALLSVGVLALILLQYQTIFGKTAGSAVLIAFTGLKIFETSTIRDAMVCNILITVVVLAGFLFDQSPASAAFGLVCLVLVIANFNMLAAPGRFGAVRALRLTSGIVLLGVPLALIAYILFPRIEGSLWGIAEEVPRATSGLSDTIAPGSITELSLNDAVAFRVDFDGPAPEREDLYWRVLVLDRFDGRTWTRSPGFRSAPENLDISGPNDTLSYRIVLEASNKPWLPILELPMSISGRNRIGNLATVIASKPVRERTRYSAESALVRYLNDGTTPDAARRVPPTVDDDVRALAEEFAAPDDGAEAIAMRVLAMFRQQEFYYTLSPPALGDDPVRDFLFETRRGYCEHYASAFTTLMRAAGIPARVVLGYQGGEQNPSGDHWIVRQSDAHAWSEIWVEGRGWMRVDPTAAVAPERVELGMNALRRLDSAGALDTPFSAERMREVLRLDWLSARIKQMELFADAFTHQWNIWVMAYGPEQQQLLMTRLGFNAPDRVWMVLALGASLAAFMLVIYVLLSLGGREPESPLKYYRRFGRKLHRAGLPQRPSEGPRDLGRRAAARFPEHAAQIEAISSCYIALRYGREGGGRLVELRRRVRDLRIGGSARTEPPGAVSERGHRSPPSG